MITESYLRKISITIKMKKKDKQIINSIISSIKKVTRNKDASSLHEPTLSKLEIKYLNNCIKTNMLSTIGPYINIFENKIKKVTKSKHVIATINGTSALHIALLLIGLKKNDEVLIPSLNFIASTNATLYCGGIPHFVDVEEKTLGVDIRKLNDYLKKNTKQISNTCINKKTNRKIIAIIPTHLFGNPVNMKELIFVAKKFNLKVIEDAAEGVGSYFMKKHVGTFGNFGILSFNGNKSVTTGGGGVLLTNNTKLANEARHLISVSKVKNKYDLVHDKIGFNYKMTNLHAAIGCAQLDKIKKLLSKKRKLFKAYSKEFSKHRDLHLLKEPKNARSNYWLNTIIIKENKKFLRDNIIKSALKKSIGVRPVWKPLPELNFLKSYPRMNISQTKKLFNRIINIPSSSHLI